MTIIATMIIIMYTNVPKTIYKSRVKIGYIYFKTVLGNIIPIRDVTEPFQY
jgi:hypothetical protein